MFGPKQRLINGRDAAKCTLALAGALRTRGTVGAATAGRMAGRLTGCGNAKRAANHGRLSMRARRRASPSSRKSLMLKEKRATGLEPVSPAWENTSLSVAENTKVLIYQQFSCVAGVSQSFARLRVSSRGFAVSAAQNGIKTV